MTLPNTNSRWEYEGNGVTASFGFDNKVFSKGDLQFIVDGVTKTLDVHYTVTLNADGTGTILPTPGNIPPAPAVPGTKNVIINRVVPASQTKQFPPVGSFPAEQVAEGFDKLTVLCQQLALQLLRTFKLPDSETAVDLTLPALAVRAGRLFGWDALGKPTTYAATGDAGAIEIPVPVDQGGTGAVDAPTARDNLGLGSSATLDAGAAAGNVPVLDVNGKLADSTLPAGAAAAVALSLYNLAR